MKENDMTTYSERIKHLEEAHRVLDQKILEMQKHPHVDEQKVAEYKKQKLQYKDEISRLSCLEWNEQNERLPEDYNDH
jgi:hypothetical protein